MLLEVLGEVLVEVLVWGWPPGRAEVRCVKPWAVGVSTGGRRLRMS